jgi:hypothetical protein
MRRNSVKKQYAHFDTRYTYKGSNIKNVSGNFLTYVKQSEEIFGDGLILYLFS